MIMIIITTIMVISKPSNEGWDGEVIVCEYVVEGDVLGVVEVVYGVVQVVVVVDGVVVGVGDGVVVKVII